MKRTAGSVQAASLSRETVVRALDNCYDPCCQERRISVVDMGLIESIEIRGREVRIEMVLTSGWCPFAARLLEMIEEEVGGLPEVDDVEVEVVWDPAWTPERMSAGAREKLTLPLERLVPVSIPFPASPSFRPYPLRSRLSSGFSRVSRVLQRF